MLVALRSLFAWAKRSGLIFRNPASRIEVGQIEYSVLQPLAPDKIDRSVVAATTPAARLSSLSRQCARPGSQIATLLLDDVDIGNRRLTIADVSGPSTISRSMRSRSKVASWPRRGPRIQQLLGATSARSGLVVDQQVEVGRVWPALAPEFPASPAVVSVAPAELVRTPRLPRPTPRGGLLETTGVALASLDPVLNDWEGWQISRRRQAGAARLVRCSRCSRPCSRLYGNLPDLLSPLPREWPAVPRSGCASRRWPRGPR